jgi:hypothetical protein
MFNKKSIGWLAGTALVVALAVAGAVVGTGSALAQTVTTGTAAVAATTPTPGATTQAPPAGNRGGAPGLAGPQGGGPRGMDMGRGGPGMAATADGATNAISMTTQALTGAQSDLTYATGKMDTSNVQSWLTAAAGLLAKAKDAQTAQQYGQAVAYSEAARALISTAEMAMAQTLGADKLPSYSQQPQHGGPQGSTAQTQTPNQAQVSRELQRTYNNIVSQGVLVGTNADAAGYLTQAQDAYKTAYTAYQAGNYQAASNAARLAQSLLRVSDSLLHVADAGTSPDAPVTVPAPTF